MKALINKADIESHVNNVRTQIREIAKDDLVHSAAFFRTFDELTERFIDDIRKTVLFDCLEPEWEYRINFSYDAIELELIHIAVSGEGDAVEGIIDQSFILITTMAPFLTVSQYCEIYGVEEVTLRQWIRRGKIRTAKKFGNEWRIPAMTDYPKRRGFTRASYSVDETLYDVPNDLSYLDQCNGIEIAQDKVDRKLFDVLLYRDANLEAFDTFKLNATEKERLELFLISHPGVRYNLNPEDGIMFMIANSFIGI